MELIERGLEIGEEILPGHPPRVGGELVIGIRRRLGHGKNQKACGYGSHGVFSSRLLARGGNDFGVRWRGRMLNLNSCGRPKAGTYQAFANSKSTPTKASGL